LSPRQGAGPQFSSLRLCLVGGFTLLGDQRTVAVPATAQRLLALVALSERGILRGLVAARLWPDSSEERAAAGLRSTLWRLRRICPGIVSSIGDHLQLDSGVDVDLHQLSAEASRLRSGGWQRSDLSADAVSRFAGDLLPDWYEEWVLVERERFRQLRLHALERLCQLYIDAGRAAEAVDAGLAAVAGEPLRETAQSALIAAYVAEGNRAEALRQFDSYRQLLHHELGLEPGPELTTALGRRPRSNDPEFGGIGSSTTSNRGQ
jgi:DNA-binding SARP family transcriptional activator